MNVYHPHRHRRFLPLLCLAAGIPIVIVGAWLWIGAIVTPDEPAPDDRDLLLPAMSVPAAENGFTALQAVSDRVDTHFAADACSPTDQKVNSMLNGDDWDQAYADELVATYRTEIDTFIGLKKYQYLLDVDAADPSKITPETFPFKNIGCVRFLAQVSAIEALRQAHAGKGQAALDQGIAIARIGHLLESRNVFVIEYLVGSAVKQTGFSALRIIARTVPLQPDQAKQTALAIRDYRDSRAGAMNALKLEHSVRSNYQAQINSLEGVWAAFFESGAIIDGQQVQRPTIMRHIVRAIDRSGILQMYYRPNQTWRFAIERDRNDIEKAGLDCALVDRMDTPQPILQRHGFSLLLEPNAIGKVLYDISTISFGGYNVRRCDEAMAESVTELLLGLSAYQKENGKLPATLSALSPNYLDSIPADPYSGMAWHYLPNDQRLYSVGPNHVDEGGDRNPDVGTYANGANPWQIMKDPTFVVNAL